jgi:hypothetical protein
VVAVVARTSWLFRAEGDEHDLDLRRLERRETREFDHHSDSGPIVVRAGRLGHRVEVRADDEMWLPGIETRALGDHVEGLAGGHGYAPRGSGRNGKRLTSNGVTVHAEKLVDELTSAAISLARCLTRADVLRKLPDDVEHSFRVEQCRRFSHRRSRGRVRTRPRRSAARFRAPDDKRERQGDAKSARHDSLYRESRPAAAASPLRRRDHSDFSS